MDGRIEINMDGREGGARLELQREVRNGRSVGGKKLHMWVEQGVTKKWKECGREETSHVSGVYYNLHVAYKVDIGVLESLSGVDGDGPALVLGTELVFCYCVSSTSSSPALHIILLLITIALYNSADIKTDSEAVYIHIYKTESEAVYIYKTESEAVYMYIKIQCTVSSV